MLFVENRSLPVILQVICEYPQINLLNNLLEYRLNNRLVCRQTVITCNITVILTCYLTGYFVENPSLPVILQVFWSSSMLITCNITGNEGSSTK